MDFQQELIERFFRYVKMDTQSKEGVDESYPSTASQLELGRLLVQELSDLGCEEVELDPHGYVTATCPANLPPNHDRESVPVVGLFAHMDTYPAVSGRDVKPILHKNYAGGEIRLPGLPDKPIRPEENPDLARYVGEDIITSDGTTLLGADDKAGIAEIMTLLRRYQKDRSLLHPTLRIAFTPDEEVGNGTKFFDVKKFGAEVAYTMDGSGMGEVEDETFCADSAIITIKGVDVHPGYAKDKMVNAVRLASWFVEQFPGQSLPETTAARQSYLHPYQITGNVSEAKITALVRSFTEDGLAEMENILKDIQKKLQQKEPRAEVHLQINPSYRNMKIVLDHHPLVVQHAEEAVQRCGLTPKRTSIRGGTDGARLSFSNLPTPNLSAGGYNFHSRQEWVPVNAMVKAVEMLTALMTIWVEKGRGRPRA